MSEATRERRMLATFAKLADTLVDEYDVVDLMQLLVDSCRDLLDASAAGILLADPAGELELIASTSEASRIVEMMQLGAEAGPCIESFRTGRTVSVPDISQSPPEWSAFARSAREQGFASVHAIPLRRRDLTIGSLNLLREALGDLEEIDRDAARAFADVATIGILHERSLSESRVVQEQLQAALSSRVVIEQAKGVVAFTRKVSMDEAFDLIRGHARTTGQPLTGVAQQLVAMTLTL